MALLCMKRVMDGGFFFCDCLQCGFLCANLVLRKLGGEICDSLTFMMYVYLL